MKVRTPLQKVSLFFAFLSYVAGLASILGAFYIAHTLGRDDPWTASLMAAVVFFAGAGVVLHVMGRADLPDLTLSD